MAHLWVAALLPVGCGRDRSDEGHNASMSIGSSYSKAELQQGIRATVIFGTLNTGHRGLSCSLV